MGIDRQSTTYERLLSVHRSRIPVRTTKTSHASAHDAGTALTRYGFAWQRFLHRKPPARDLPSAHNRTTLCPALNLICSFISPSPLSFKLSSSPSPLNPSPVSCSRARCLAR
ncbi:hypothetical protein FKP32DRAFT_549361 [Trametes sanguinea]|nr:hypothetical protein FKP32DRAFT_549361 [Trametes sanguinea]